MTSRRCREVLDFLAVVRSMVISAPRDSRRRKGRTPRMYSVRFFLRFDGFEQEGVGLAFGYSEEGGDRVSRSAEIDFTTGRASHREKGGETLCSRGGSFLFRSSA